MARLIAGVLSLQLKIFVVRGRSRPQNSRVRTLKYTASRAPKMQKYQPSIMSEKYINFHNVGKARVFPRVGQGTET